MHEYRRFVRAEMDALGIDSAELVRRSGLRRQLIWKILNDDRDSLGQMPDDSTLAGLAKGLGVGLERVRTAAARSLARYTDEGGEITTDLTTVHIDALLAEIRRRVLASAAASTPPGTDVAFPSDGLPVAVEDALINRWGDRGDQTESRRLGDG